MKLSNGKEIVLWEVTRGIQKGYTKRLLWEDLTISQKDAMNEDFRVNPNNVADAQDWKIWQLTWLTIEEVESLNTSDYELIEKAVNSLDNNPS